MPGKQPNWKDPEIIKAAKEVTQRYYKRELKNRWCLEIEFTKLTGYNQRFSTIMKYGRQI